MKNFILLCLICTPLLHFSQKNYKKLSGSQLSDERKNIAQKFVNSYLEKCQKKDYAPFGHFNITGRLLHYFETNYEKSCRTIENKFGTIEIEAFDSAYLNKYSANADPIDMMIFRIRSEKDPELQFVNVWIYRDQNFIGGIYFSKERMLQRKYLN